MMLFLNNIVLSGIVVEKNPISVISMKNGKELEKLSFKIRFKCFNFEHEINVVIIGNQAVKVNDEVEEKEFIGVAGQIRFNSKASEFEIICKTVYLNNEELKVEDNNMF